MPLFPPITHRDPLVIGGTGGSGTRALHGALSAAGIFMGTRVNESGDAMDFEPFLDEAINQILGATHSLDYRLADLPAQMRRSLCREFGRALSFYAGERPPGRLWGWKNPRSMYVLPVILERCPRLRFIHMVRDGRDMAVSSNQNQARKHYAALTGRHLPEVMPAASIELWTRANLDVARLCRVRLGPRHRMIRFEDLCANPAEVLAGLLKWIRPGLESARTVAAAANAIALPPSLGRWRTLEPGHLADLGAVGQEALVHFGYV